MSIDKCEALNISFVLNAKSRYFQVSQKNVNKAYKKGVNQVLLEFWLFTFLKDHAVISIVHFQRPVKQAAIATRGNQQ